jgi:hypothetical protein
MWELLAIGVMAAGAWFWVDSLRAREGGVAAARRACAAAGYQLLDDTVAINSIRPARDDNGHMRLRRVYAFEFTDTGDNRRRGWVSLIGADIETTYIGSYLG